MGKSKNDFEFEQRVGKDKDASVYLSESFLKQPGALDALVQRVNEHKKAMEKEVTATLKKPEAQ